MALHAVSYDLHNVKNYDPLWDALKKSGGARILESLWLISVPQTSVQLKDALKTYVDGDDSIVVIELNPSSDWASTRARPAGTEWLKKFMP